MAISRDFIYKQSYSSNSDQTECLHVDILLRSVFNPTSSGRCYRTYFLIGQMHTQSFSRDTQNEREVSIDTSPQIIDETFLIP